MLESFQDSLNLMDIKIRHNDRRTIQCLIPSMSTYQKISDANI